MEEVEVEVEEVEVEVEEVESNDTQTPNTSMEDGLFISVTCTNSNNSERIVDLSNKEETSNLIEEVDSTLNYIPTDSDPILENTNDTNYEEYAIKDLKTTLESMGLTTSGNKAKLIERIVSNKK